MRALVLGLALSTAAFPAIAASKDAVVVELFTAQGCGECPAANEFVLDLAGMEGVIALTYPVDYWDYLGWKDGLARPEFVQRQRAYKAAFKLRDVYTPQVVIDGDVQLSGVDHAAIQKEVDERIDVRDYPPDMAFLPNARVAVGSGRAPRGGADVWLVRYAPEPIAVEVTRGDNRGQTVRQGNVVRELVKLGPWRGKPRVYRLPTGAEDLETVVLVQAVRDGRILGAKKG
jgi:hypothetical protein